MVISRSVWSNYIQRHVLAQAAPAQENGHNGAPHDNGEDVDDGDDQGQEAGEQDRDEPEQGAQGQEGGDDGVVHEDAQERHEQAQNLRLRWLVAVEERNRSGGGRGRGRGRGAVAIGARGRGRARGQRQAAAEAEQRQPAGGLSVPMTFRRIGFSHVAGERAHIRELMRMVAEDIMSIRVLFGGVNVQVDNFLARMLQREEIMLQRQENSLDANQAITDWRQVVAGIRNLRQLDDPFMLDTYINRIEGLLERMRWLGAQ